MPAPVNRRDLPTDLAAYDDLDDYEETYDEAKLLGDVLSEEPNTDEYEGHCVMVFGIPIIGSDRLPKLKSVLGKLFGYTNPTYTDHFPLDSEGKTKVIII